MLSQFNIPYISYHATKKEAVQALAKEQIQPTSPKANIAFKELYDEWKGTPSFTGISKQTQDNYVAAFKHLSPLHGKTFTAIRAGHIQTLIDGLVSVDKKGNSKPLSRSTKDKVKLLCGLLYKYAMQNDICNKNYAEFVKLQKEERKEKEIFTDLEIKTLENNRGLPYVDTILILVYTGLRISELLELTKFAVDLKAMTITGGLKTDAGKNRVAPIHPKALPYIRQWYNNATDRLIFKGDNEPVTANYYRKYIYYPILEKLGIERKTPHATRHTCATLLARAGADTNAIKMILGHTDYAFTADTYTHADIGFLAAEISKI
ncbi:MAG: Tyrosine recombinase XerD [Firmicutes bacterium ADurb.Bin193]|nr:MAG: Tyrosine recombinase XerD [Firmicutes bacterium ADurb.Bin193]